MYNVHEYNFFIVRHANYQFFNKNNDNRYVTSGQIIYFAIFKPFT